jgi:hypothetical protein
MLTTFTIFAIVRVLEKVDDESGGMVKMAKRFLNSF